MVCPSAQCAMMAFSFALAVRNGSDGSAPRGSTPRISTRVPEERVWISRTISATPSATFSGVLPPAPMLLVPISRIARRGRIGPHSAGRRCNTPWVPSPITPSSSGARWP